jgi:DNA-binding NarL/FixJ family response regulator
VKIRVALAEDNHLLALSIQEKIELFSDEISFSFRAENGKDLLEKLSKNHAIDVILMDIEMPEMDGISATQQIASQYPQIKIVILTIFDDDQRIFNAIKAGALGYLLKDVTPQKLRESILMVAEGGAPMTGSIAAKTLKFLRGPAQFETHDRSESFNLSKREVQVLEQLSKGLDYKETAENLFISPATVRKHIENIYRKLQVNNKIGAINKASRHGLL